MPKGVMKKMTSTQKGYVFMVAPIVLIAFVVFCSPHKQDENNKHSSSQSGKKEVFSPDEVDMSVDEYDIDKSSYGPCSGIVLDAETRKPIAGAQVMGELSFIVD